VLLEQVASHRLGLLLLLLLLLLALLLLMSCYG